MKTYLMLIILFLSGALYAQDYREGEIVIYFKANNTNCRFKADAPIWDNLVDVEIDSVVGYSSNEGDIQNNLRLSQERALSVGLELSLYGTSIPIIGKGSTNQFGDEPAPNRRVIIYCKRYEKRKQQ